MHSSEDVYHLGIKALIRNVKGEILLLQVNPKKLIGITDAYWDLPGGRVQKGDTVIDTLRREVEEETGITHISEICQISMVLSNIRIPVDNGSVGFILDIYSCVIEEGCDIVLSDEHIGYKWFSTQDASHKLSIKYPPDFCEQISKLSNATYTN